MKIEVTQEEANVVKTALLEQWSHIGSRISSYRDMLVGREHIPIGRSRQDIVNALGECEEKSNLHHNLIRKFEDDNVSKFGPGKKVVITAPQDTYEGQHAVVKQSIMTEKGDFVHLVRIESGTDIAPETMYEEKNLQELK